jgi:hypothetical protein
MFIGTSSLRDDRSGSTVERSIDFVVFHYPRRVVRHSFRRKSSSTTARGRDCLDPMYVVVAGAIVRGEAAGLLLRCPNESAHVDTPEHCTRADEVQGRLSRRLSRPRSRACAFRSSACVTATCVHEDMARDVPTRWRRGSRRSADVGRNSCVAVPGRGRQRETAKRCDSSTSDDNDAIRNSAARTACSAPRAGRVVASRPVRRTPSDRRSEQEKRRLATHGGRE